jgi:hypothetical protein
MLFDGRRSSPHRLPMATELNGLLLPKAGLPSQTGCRPLAVCARRAPGLCHHWRGNVRLVLYQRNAPVEINSFSKARAWPQSP